MRVLKIIYLTVFCLGVFSLPQYAHAVCSNNEDGEPGQSGEIEYFTGDNALRYCDDTNWIDMKSANIFSGYAPNAVLFDDLSDTYLSMSSAISGVTDTKQLTGSFWIRIDDLTGGDEWEFFDSGTSGAGSGDHELAINDSGEITFNFEDPTTGGVIDIDIQSPTLDDGNWHHVMFSFDVNGASGTCGSTCHIYVDGVAAATLDVNDFVDALIDADHDYSIGGTTTGTDIQNGGLADFWIDFGTYIDLSIPSNRRLFYNYGPVSLGSTGDNPTGTAPDIFLSGDTSTWHTNDGTGGGFIENGALVEAPSPAQSFAANPVEFDGTNDYLRTSYAGPTNPTEISGSFWINRNDLSSGFSQIVMYADDGTNGRFRIRLPFSTNIDTILIDAQNAAGSNERMMHSTTKILNDGWYHVLFSFDVTDNTKRQIYINDVDATVPDTDTLSEIGLGGSGIITVAGEALSGNNKLNGELAEVWVDFGNYIDFSVEANRRNFITSDKKPVNLGTDGSRPTGSAPEVYLSGDTATWHTNDGTTAGFTEFGAITDGTGPVQTTGLIGYWTLDETSGSSIADSSGNGNTGTWTDGGDNDVTGETSPGQVGTALDFGPGNKLVNAGSAAIFDNMYSNGGMSVCAWVYPNSVPGASAPIINKNGPASGNYGWSMSLGKAAGNVYVFYTNLDSYISPNVSYTLNEWQHICFTWDGNEGTAGLTSYVNGAEPSGTTYLGDDSATVFNDSSYNLSIGYDTSDSTSFDGEIDDVRIYNRVISASEVATLTECTRPGTYFYNEDREVMQWCNGAGSPIDMGLSDDGGTGTCNQDRRGSLNYSGSTGTYYYCNGDYNVPIGKSCTSCGGSGSEKVMFISMDSTNGQSIGGISGGDAKCQEAADNAGLSGTYFAWLADSTLASAPAMRFSVAIRSGAYSIVRPDGVTIADDWADLTDGTLDNAPYNSEFGVTMSSTASSVHASAATNVTANGMRKSATDHCSNWSANSGSANKGRTFNTNSDWTDFATPSACNNGLHIYCVEQ